MIKATDALRTGTYSKTLTFTLVHTRTPLREDHMTPTKALALLAVATVAPLRSPPTPAPPTSPTHAIAPGDTDPAIIDTASPTPGRAGRNLVWLAPAQRRVGKLLVFLPYGGLDQRTTEYEEVGSRGRTARLSHDRPRVPQRRADRGRGRMWDPRGPAARCREKCARNARQEILDGHRCSPVVDVDQANSIENRLNKMLVHLRTNFPSRRLVEVPRRRRQADVV